MPTKPILVDARWNGHTGIGRFSSEILSRLTNTVGLHKGPSPLSLSNLVWQSYVLSRNKQFSLYFTPGFNPPMRSKIPFVFTLHDLIHLHQPTRFYYFHKMFYQAIIKPATQKAHAIITVSHYSKESIMNWCGIAEEKIIVIPNAVSEVFLPFGEKYNPGFPYLLHVGNTRAHKNVARLIQALALSTLVDIHLICTGIRTPSLAACIAKYGMEQRIHFHSQLSEAVLANYYRGAMGVVFPSLYEGFGMPVLEGMASGVPVLTSNVTSLPEIAGGAAVLIDPYGVDNIIWGIEQLVLDNEQRKQCIQNGLLQVKRFSWQQSAITLQHVLDEV